jgi:hypothetical protein
VGPRLIALAAFVIVGGTAAIFLARSAPPMFPVSDIALTELYTRDAARAQLLVGPYSRFGWHHPGPAYFYLLAPFYAIGGRHAAALSAGAMVLSLVAVAAIVWTSERYLSCATTIVMLATLVICLWRVEPLMVSSWNPHAVILPAAALMMMSAALASGRATLLPAVIALASFLVQTDVALVPFVAAVVLTAVAWSATASAERFPVASSAKASAERNDSGETIFARLTPSRDGNRAIGISAATLAIMWSLPIAEQLSHSPGNLAALWRFFVHGSAASRLTLAQALAIWSDAMTAPFRPAFHLANGTPLEPVLSPMHVVAAIALAIAVAAAAIVAHRRRRPALTRLAMLSLAASIATLWSATRIEGGVSDHQSFWFAIVGVMDVASTVAIVLGSWSPAPTVARSMVVALLGLALAIGLRQMDRVRRGVIPVTDSAPSVPNFAASIRQYLDRTRSRRPLFRLDERQWGLGVGILLELDRAAVPFAVEESWMPMFPDRFRPDGREDAELTLAARGASAELARRPGNETVDESTFIHVEAVPRAR